MLPIFVQSTHFCGPSMSPETCLVSSLGEIISKEMGASGMKAPSAGVEGGVGGATGVELAAPAASLPITTISRHNKAAYQRRGCAAIDTSADGDVYDDIRVTDICRSAFSQRPKKPIISTGNFWNFSGLRNVRHATYL